MSFYLKDLKEDIFNAANKRGLFKRDEKVVIFDVIKELLGLVESFENNSKIELNDLIFDIVEGDVVKTYKQTLLGSFEDEISDVIITIISLSMFFELDIFKYIVVEEDRLLRSPLYHDVSDCFLSNILTLNYVLSTVFKNMLSKDFKEYEYSAAVFMGSALCLIYNTALKENIDIERHIKLKVEYNKMRSLNEQG